MTTQSVFLSLFPSIDMLGMAFKQVFPEACIVHGPDKLWGWDVKDFHVPPRVFNGIFGGPPCQDFTPMAAINRSLGRIPKYGNLIPEFERCVEEGQPDWFLMENVERAPKPEVPGYQVVHLALNNRWFGEKQCRKRRFSFGTRQGLPLVVDGLVALESIDYEPAVISTRGWMAKSGAACKSGEAVERDKAARRRSTEQLAELQGLPPDFLADAPFTEQGKRKVIANGVPLAMGLAIAKAVRRALSVEAEAAS